MGHVSVISEPISIRDEIFFAQSEPEVSLDWDEFDILKVSNNYLAQNNIICAARKETACGAFDFLRTRMMQVMKEKKWNRIGITSPTEGCGKTFISANLSITLARGLVNRVLLLDMNLKKPGLEKIFTTDKNRSMANYLAGTLDPKNFFFRVMPNLMVGLNNDPVSESTEILQDAQTSATLDKIQTSLAPDLTVVDMPSLLTCDDAISCFSHLDGVIMVVEGGKTTKAEIRCAEKLMTDRVPLLGVVLNRSKGKCAMVG